MEKKVEFEILNSTYSVKTKVPESDFKNIIAILNKKLNDIKNVSGTETTYKLILLTAIYLAGDIYQGEKKIDSIIEKLSFVENL